MDKNSLGMKSQSPKRPFLPYSKDMLHLQEILALQEGEQIVSVVRRSLMMAAPRLALAGILIALPFFFLFPLIRLGFIGTVMICIGLAAGAYLALKSILLWDANVVVLTDRRFIVVRQEGLWSRRVIEAPLTGCQVTVARQGMLGLMRIGEIAFSGQGLSVPLVVSGLPSAEALARSIQGLRDAQTAGFKLKTV